MFNNASPPGPTRETSRQVVTPDQTVPPKVEYENRVFTDIPWGVVNILAYIAFLATGFVVVGRAHPIHVTLEDGIRGLNDYYMADAEQCCAGGNSGTVCSLYEDRINGSRRLEGITVSKFDGDEGIFDTFVEAPMIIVGLLSIVLAVSLIWIVLLRFFAKPIVIIVEIAKVAAVIYMGIVQQETGTRVICFICAALMIGYIFWAWKKIMFAAKIIEHSTIAMKERPSVFVGGFFIKIFYAGNAALFVLFFSQSFGVTEIQELNGFCDFVYPDYVMRISIFWSLSYLWTLLLFSQMRLSITSAIVGSWHFHPEDNPGVLKAIKNIVKSYGTLSISSLIATVADKVNRMMSQDAIISFLSPTICFTWPLHCFMCIFGSCIYTCVKMLTSYAVVLHVFTGRNFLGSAKASFNILSRHFKGGFVTEVTSRSLFSLTSYVFSVCVALIAWAWIDAEFQAGSLPSEADGYAWILYIIVLIFNVYYPVLGLYVMILVNRLLRDFDKSNREYALETGTDYIPINHLWVPPLAATFVGCIAMMIFTFVSSIFLDIITTLFLCFAIDKDNNVDMNGNEFDSLVKEMPNYIDCDVLTAVSSSDAAEIGEGSYGQPPTASAPWDNNSVGVEQPVAIAVPVKH